MCGACPDSILRMWVWETPTIDPTWRVLNARAESRAPELLADSTEQVTGSTCSALPGGLPCWHAGSLHIGP